jgi:hypothetical protein
MSEPKFTKGPWHIDTELRGILDQDGHYISVNGANSTLVVAAPELYEMVQYMISQGFGAEYDENYQGWNESTERKQAIKRLAKIRGDL